MSNHVYRINDSDVTSDEDRKEVHGARGGGGGWFLKNKGWK